MTPAWLSEAERIKSEQRLSYARIGALVGASRQEVYYWLVTRSKTFAERTCRGCGVDYQARDIRQVYCSRPCWREHAPSPASRPEVADKISARKFKHGKSTGLRQRQLQNAGMTVQGKGETCCRACSRTDQRLHLHHAIPRSMWKAGILEPLNGVSLCVACHMGWHNRHVTLFRDMFTPEEWACISSANLIGQNVTAWLDERYPARVAAAA